MSSPMKNSGFIFKDNKSFNLLNFSGSINVKSTPDQDAVFKDSYNFFDVTLFLVCIRTRAP